MERGGRRVKGRGKGRSSVAQGADPWGRAAHPTAIHDRREVPPECPLWLPPPVGTALPHVQSPGEAVGNNTPPWSTGNLRSLQAVISTNESAFDRER